MQISALKENFNNENRVALTPDTIKLFDDTAWPPQKAHGLARNLWLVSPLQWNVLAVDLANAGAAAPAGGAPSGKNVPARHAGHY